MIPGKARLPWAVASLAVLWGAGCKSDIDVQPPLDPPFDQRVQAIFDPTGDPPQVPTPTDLAKDPVTGLLAVPVADAATQPAQAEFDAYLNSLDGYPTTAGGEVKFSGQLQLDAATAAQTLGQAIKVLAIDTGQTPPAVTPVAADDLVFGESFDAAAGVHTVTIEPKAAWARGTTYAFYVLGGEAGLKDTAGRPVVRSATFELAAVRNPLCLVQDNKCVFNYSAVLEGQVAPVVEAANPGVHGHELEVLIEQAVLQTGTSLELGLRQGIGGDQGLLTLGDQAGIPRDQVALAWGFTTVGLTEVAFDPTTGVIPGPANDVLLAQADGDGCTAGHVCIPASEGETPAQAAQRAGLNSLDGFSTTASSWAVMLGPVDPASVTPEAFKVLDLGSFAAVETAEVVYDETAGAIVFTPTAPLKEKTRYAVVLISELEATPSQQAAGGLKDPSGRRIVPSPVFALGRLSAPLVDEGGKSTVSVLDDASAAQLEALRAAQVTLFSLLKNFFDVERNNVVGAWVFTTQSVSEPLVGLRAAMIGALNTADGGSPSFTGTCSDDLSAFPADRPKGNIDCWVADGRFTSLNALDPTTRAFLPPDRMNEAAPEQVPFWLTVPVGTAPANGWPVVLYQHGLNGAKLQMSYLADELAAAGYATLAFDTVLHGERTKCAKDADCATGGTCDTASGACSNGTFADSDSDGVPDASGGDLFLDTSNPFAIRDNFRQQVIDAAAVLRAIQLGAAADLTAAPPVRLDASRVHLVGLSLGGILGPLVLATDSLPQRGVLAAPGGPLVAMVEASPNLGPILEGVRQARGITAGSLDDLQLRALFQWILDPADPINFAGFVTEGELDDKVAGGKVTAKDVIVISGSADETIPAAFHQNIADQLGVDTTKTTYANQGHGLLVRASPDATATQAAQAQMVKFLDDGQICTPDPTAGTCQ